MTAEQKAMHTPEPWHVWDRGVGWEVHAGPEPAGGKHWWVAGENGHEKSGECQGLHDGFRDTIPIEANARRIVACVNALKGVPTEQLEAEGRVTIALLEALKVGVDANRGRWCAWCGSEDDMDEKPMPHTSTCVFGGFERAIALAEGRQA